MAAGLAALAGVALFDADPTAFPDIKGAAVAHKPRVAAKADTTPNGASPAERRYGALLDPAPSLGVAPVVLGQSVPLGPTFEGGAAESVVALAEADGPAPAATEPVMAEAEPVPASPAEAEAESTPVPAPRPPEFRAPGIEAPARGPRRQIASQARAPGPSAAPSDNRNFIQKLFGMGQPSGPVLAYASPDDGLFGNAHGLTSGPALPYDRQTAVYDIAAHTVYLPNGTRLEAHSGLGDRLDDARFVHERMRGPTPPQTYDLTLREQLFHGVQALRLNPVGGGGTYGRTGLLAHTFMLGPNGDSNGCVSFRNYQAFLQAYLKGEVRRLVVVARMS